MSRALHVHEPSDVAWYAALAVMESRDMRGGALATLTCDPHVFRALVAAVVAEGGDLAGRLAVAEAEGWATIEGRGWTVEVVT